MRSCWSQRAGDAAVVGHQHQRRPGLAVELEHQRHHRLAGGEVEAAGRLVGEQQRRPDDEGARQRDALLLAARQHLADSGAAARPGRPGAASRWPAARASAAALQLERQHHVLERVQVAEQLEALEHEADLGGAHRGALVLVDREEVDAVEPDRAVGRRVEPGDDRQQRALARARGADDGHRALRARRVKSMSWRIVSVPVESLHALGQALDGDDGFGHG